MPTTWENFGSLTRWMSYLGIWPNANWPALVWALYADVADHGEWKHGRRATGLVFSAAMFAQKTGLTIGGAASGWMLDAFGFVPNETQTDDALLGIRLMFCVIPGTLALLNGLVLLGYPLTAEQTKQMQEELAARRASEGSDSTAES